MAKEYIEREPFFQFLQSAKEPITGAYTRGLSNGLGIALSAIHNRQITPTANVVEVASGTWEEVNLPRGATWNLTEAAICPACKQAFDAAKLTNIKYGNNDYKLPKHCPECGAKMTGGKSK